MWLISDLREFITALLYILLSAVISIFYPTYFIDIVQKELECFVAVQKAILNWLPIALGFLLHCDLATAYLIKFTLINSVTFYISTEKYAYLGSRKFTSK